MLREDEEFTSPVLEFPEFRAVQTCLKGGQLGVGFWPPLLQALRTGKHFGNGGYLGAELIEFKGRRGFVHKEVSLLFIQIIFFLLNITEVALKQGKALRALCGRKRFQLFEEIALLLMPAV